MNPRIHIMKIVQSCIIPLVFLFVFNSCATTSLHSVWVDDTYQGGTLKKIFIIGVIQPDILRKYFENEFVKQLKDKGIMGVASNKVFPDDIMPNKQELRFKLKELNADSVLIARLVDVSSVHAYMTYPPSEVSSEGFYGFYTICCQNIVSLGYDVRFETKFFTAKDDKLLWSASSVTDLEKSPVDMTNSYISAVIDNLEHEKLIP